jgi:tRNA dimethylallyltransferase
VSDSDAPQLLVVVGPTASGKTELAVRMAERVGGEIVSADSVQIYRHFDVGTGKPSPGELARAPHHLIDVVEPLEPMDAGRFVELAERALEEVRRRGRVPIVCGGTFLWVKALVHGLVEAPPADPAVRERHRVLADSEGRAALHARLAAVDPESARRLAPNDFVRVSRALEVHELTGEPLSVVHARHGFRAKRHEALLFGVERAPSELDERIRARVHAMLAGGFVDEVVRLLERGFGASRAMGSVGYRQIREALAAGTAADRANLAETIVRATRVFARRQRTWLRREPVVWLAPGALPEAELATGRGA